MPNKLPDLPKVDKATGWQGVKKAVAKLREEFLRSYLLDSASVTVVDNPGKGRSAEVNFPNQGAGLPSVDITIAGTETIPDGGLWREITASFDVPDRTPVAVDMGEQAYPITFVGSKVESGQVYLRFYTATGGSATMTSGTIRVTALEK
jgi:hypothetical protein